MDLLWLLKDFRNFALYMVTDVIINIASITGIWLIAARFNGIGGMGIYQVLFMLGYSLTVSGVTNTLFSYNVYFISRIIGRGQMDHVLIMPQPVWMTLLTEGFIPVSGSGVLLSGIGIITYALSRLDNLVNPVFIAALILCICFSVLISLSFSFLWGSLAFYAPVAAEEVCTSVDNLFSSLRSFPLNGIAGVGKYFMLSILPVGLYAWFPSLVLMRLSSPGNIGIFIAIALAYLGLVLVIFRRGLHYYVKNGANRYSDRGHRR
jgi:ABC-2 type transport system permease protein